MLIFSTIAAIIAPIIYFIPFIFLWKKEGHSWYKMPKTNNEIKNKHVFIAKIILLVILSVVFAFTWPTKVMFYPLKVAIFILALVVIQFLTVFITDSDNGKVSDKIFSTCFVCWIILILLAIVVGVGGGETYNDKVIEAPYESTETLQVEHISNGNVFFYDETDESIEVISIADERLEIVFEENDSQQPYLEKISRHSRYSKLYVKEKIIYDDKTTLNEEYILHVSKSDLYK